MKSSAFTGKNISPKNNSMRPLIEKDIVETEAILTEYAKSIC